MIAPALEENPTVMSVQNVHKRFGSNHVLKGISLDFKEGTTTVILGGSGSGKTVLMKHY